MASVARLAPLPYTPVMDPSHMPTIAKIPALGALCAAAMFALPASAAPSAAPPPAPTYADLATLADGAPLAVRIRVKNQISVPAERAPGLAAGEARLYIEAQTLALLAGSTTLPESLRYLVDVPLDAKGKVPKLKKQEFVLFARPVAGRPGELQLVGTRAQLPYTAALETWIRPVLAAFAAADTPPRVTGVRDVLSSMGNLAGESETQIFLTTAGGEPAALTVVRRPRNGAALGGVVDRAGRPVRPARTGGNHRLVPPRLLAAGRAARRRQSRQRSG